MAVKATKKAAAPVEPDEIDDLEELDEDEVEETPKKKSAADEVVFGVADLAKHLSKGKDKAVTTRELRTLIRKMARDDSGRVNRVITAGNRSRYSWSGLNDPEVKAIINAFNNGELEADKAEKLAALKERKAAQKAAGETTTKKTAAKKKAAPVVEVEDDEDDEELELDDDE